MIHEQPNQWHVICGPNDNAAMHIRQDAEVKTAVIEKDQMLEVKATQHINYVHVISGSIKLQNIFFMQVTRLLS